MLLIFECIIKTYLIIIYVENIVLSPYIVHPLLTRNVDICIQFQS